MCDSGSWQYGELMQNTHCLLAIGRKISNTFKPWQFCLQLEIIDACVSYIESLQDQLRAHDPKILDGVCETTAEDDEDTEGGDDDSNNNNGDSKSTVISPKRRNSLRENQRLRWRLRRLQWRLRWLRWRLQWRLQWSARRLWWSAGWTQSMENRFLLCRILWLRHKWSTGFEAPCIKWCFW